MLGLGELNLNHNRNQGKERAEERSKDKQKKNKEKQEAEDLGNVEKRDDSRRTHDACELIPSDAAAPNAIRTVKDTITFRSTQTPPDVAFLNRFNPLIITGPQIFLNMRRQHDRQKDTHTRSR